MVTYATITGQITIPESDIGIRGTLYAHPQTTGGALVIAGTKVTLGASSANTDGAGNLPDSGGSALRIPLGTVPAPADMFWKFVFIPENKKLPSWTAGVFQITASGPVRLDELVEPDITLVSPELAASVAANAAAAAASQAAAAASATAAQGWADAALSSAADADASADAADVSEANAGSSASAAAGSASAAAGSASSASTSASTASTKAGEAATSASNAATSATAAQTARTGAETARSGAEAAAASVPGSWQPATFYTANSNRVAPDGSMISRNTDGTSRATYDATEQAAWTPVLAKSGTQENAALNLSYVGRRAPVYDDPTARADGAVAAGMPLAAGTVFNNTGQKKIKLVGGRYLHDPAAASGSSSAGYLQIQTPGGAVARILRAMVAWPANALGAVAYVFPSSLATWDHDAGTLPCAPVHLTTYGNGIWNVGVWNPAAGQSGHVDHSVQPGTVASFKLTVQTTTPASTQTTASITAGASAATVQAAIEALSNVAPGAVTVRKSSTGNYGLTWASSLGAVTLTATPTGGTMGMAAPLPTNPNNTIAGVVSYASGLTKYGEDTTVGRYATVWDSNLRPLEAYVDPSTNSVQVIFPDGSTSGPMVHPAIGLWHDSDKAIVELFENNTSAVDTPAQFGEFSADSVVFTKDSSILSKTAVLDLIAGKKAVVLYEGSNATGADLTASGAIPPGTVSVEVIMVAAGAGAGSGGCNVAGAACTGGSAGGSGGVLRERIPATALGTSWNAQLGKPGVGGASVSATGNGNSGTAANPTFFTSGSVSLRALGGGSTSTAGQAGTSAGSAGGAGGPFASAGSSAGASGGAGGAGANVSANLGTAGSGGGGGLTTGDVASNGGKGGDNLVRNTTGGTAGVVGGAAPTVGLTPQGTAITAPVAGVPGPGAGGGASSATGAAQAGADAISYGIGGGGGGASRNGFASGRGGNGGPSYIRVVAHLM